MPQPLNRIAARSPWFFVPSLYFQQGLPVILVQQFSVLMYKKLGIPNEKIGLWTSLVALPWILKLFWGPLVDLHSTKLRWVRHMQVLITVFLALSAFFVTSENFLALTLTFFVMTAFFSATHDNALDAYYLVALKPEQQAFFLGIRSTFFRLAMIFCTGTLVMLAGVLETRGWEIAKAWQAGVFVAAVLYGVLMIYGFWAAPVLSEDISARNSSAQTETGVGFREAFRTFFAQDRVIVILLFILLYRFGESMLSKMSGLFLLDSREVGGLGLSTMDVGLAIGNVGVISLVVGGLLGGILISKIGLRRCLWPMAMALYLPNLFYVWASQVQPGLGAVSWIIAIDQFGYGFGMASYMVYAMSVCQKTRYKAAHYAIVTGIMALGAMTAGIGSGYLQKALGYPGFFLAVCLFTIPGLVLLQWIPIEAEKLKDDVLVATAEG